MTFLNSKPRLLDLCCRAGGTSVGYARAGFEVVGVDILPQRHYPFEFHQADAFEFVTVTGNCSGADYARLAMGIDWMVRDDLSQAIPPAYTELIGKQLLQLMG